MTEQSYFWNGITRGDAGEAPYNADEYAMVVDHLYGASGILGNYPVAGDGNFNVSLSAGMVVAVDSGYAVIKGKFVYNSASAGVTLSAAHATLNRWDRVVLRVDYPTKDITIALLTGIPAATPDVPALTQLANVRWEMSLAKIYVPAAAIAVSNNYIHDEREYVLTPFLLNNYSFKNLLINSEFIADIRDHVGWIYTGTATSQDKTFSYMTRGRTVRLSASSTINTVVPRAHTKTQYVTLKGRVEVITGSGYVSVTPVQFGTGLGTVVTKQFPTPGVYDFTVRYLCNSANHHGIRVIFGADASSSMDVGQCTLGEGPIAPSFGPNHEIIFIETADSYAYPAISSGNIDITRAQLPIRQTPYETGIRTLLFRLNLSDTGSAGAASVFAGFRAITRTQYIMITRVSTVVNTRNRETVGFVPLSILPTSALQITATASGANTATVEAFLVGMVV